MYVTEELVPSCPTQKTLKDFKHQWPCWKVPLSHTHKPSGDTIRKAGHQLKGSFTQANLLTKLCSRVTHLYLYGYCSPGGHTYLKMSVFSYVDYVTLKVDKTLVNHVHKDCVIIRGAPI